MRSSCEIGFGQREILLSFSLLLHTDRCIVKIDTMPITSNAKGPNRYLLPGTAYSIEKSRRQASTSS